MCSDSNIHVVQVAGVAAEMEKNVCLVTFSHVIGVTVEMKVSSTNKTAVSSSNQKTVRDLLRLSACASKK